MHHSLFTYPGRAAWHAAPERSEATGRPRATARGGPWDNVPRSKVERETGIEPATNSLEGCDSTTELLPPTHPLRSIASPRLARQPARHELCLTSPSTCQHYVFCCLRSPLSFCSLRYGLACRAAARSPARERRLVAREGFEPSKPLGRQIYSLLRLTASLPRRYPPADAPGLTFVVRVLCVSGFAPLAIRAVLLLAVSFGSRSFGSRFRRETWSWRRDLNPRPADYKSAALPD
jgi:hypothetical protein